MPNHSSQNRLYVEVSVVCTTAAAIQQAFRVYNICCITWMYLHAVHVIQLQVQASLPIYALNLCWAVASLSMLVSVCMLSMLHT